MSVAPISSATNAATALAASGKPAALRNLPAAEQVKAAAGQFEAIILRELLQDSVGKMTGGEGQGGGMYGYMMTDVLANKLTEGGGLGFGRMLQKQLTPRGAATTASPADPVKGTP